MTNLAHADSSSGAVECFAGVTFGSGFALLAEGGIAGVCAGCGNTVGLGSNGDASASGGCASPDAALKKIKTAAIRLSLTDYNRRVGWLYQLEGKH